MDIAVTHTPAAQDTSEIYSPSFDHASFLALLQQASERAIRSGQEVLASFTQPVVPRDPLQAFVALKALNLGDSVFWARPAEQRALVGVGVTLTVETSGSTRVTAAAAAWRDLQHKAVVGKTPGVTPGQTDGPILFGGFTFDPLNPRTELWEGFPDGLLLLPYLLFHRNETSAAITVNTLVKPTDDIAQRSEEIAGDMQRLQASLKGSEARSYALESTTQTLTVRDILPASVWMDQVAHAVEMIGQGAFEKVVLARSVRVTNERSTFDIAAILHRLRESYPKAYVFALERNGRSFVGATPERLVCGADGQLLTMALAGSYPRGETQEEDERLGNELLRSEKNQGEHHVVVATISRALANLCSRVWVADAPRLLKLKNIQHLETPIAGDLLPGHSILEAIEDLHPTPAVGGFPRLPALEAIREYEHLDRGWYASPIGWIGASGNGEFAVALRSGLVEGNVATLFAGCGIVADSQLQSEYDESCLKLQVMLRGLGGE